MNHGDYDEQGSYQDYAYTGGMQSVTIPQDGIYKFEVWGAGGSNSALHGGGAYGNNYNTNGKGGYSVGYKLCKKGEVYYICVGGCNVPYNGGGVGDAGWGGGATHIATKTGELKTYPATRRRCCWSPAAEAARGRPTAWAAWAEA